MPIRFPRNSEDAKTSPVQNQPEIKIEWVLSKPRFHLQDLILQGETQRQLLDVIAYFENRPLLFDQWGLKEKYADRDCLAVNLYGPPGTGKTMAAHAIVDKIGRFMVCVDYADIESKYVGDTSKNLKSLFQFASAHDAVIFFDEADALLSKRVINMTSAADVSVNQTRSVLLTLLNDYKGVILFATNFIQNFDSAFLRRIRYHIKFHLPDKPLRQALWQTYIPSRMPIEPERESLTEILSEKYDKISGSDITNAVFSAAVSAARDKCGKVTLPHFDAAVQHLIEVKLANENIIGDRSVTPEEIQHYGTGQAKFPD